MPMGGGRAGARAWGSPSMRYSPTPSLRIARMNLVSTPSHSYTRVTDALRSSAARPRARGRVRRVRGAGRAEMAAAGPVKNPPLAPSSATPDGTGARHTGPVIRRRAVDEILQLPATQVLGLHAHGEADRIHEVRLACRAEVGAYGTAGALVPAGAPSPERPALLPRLPLCAPAPFGPTTAEKSKKGPSVVLPP